MSEKIFNKKERKAIFELFLRRTRMKFSDVQKSLNLRSNHLAYHMKLLVDANILEKRDDFYFITNDAQKYIPLFSNLAGESLSPLPVVLVALINDNKVLMVKRENRPYKGYWSMIGGRILHSESYREASLRLVEKKSGISDLEFAALCEIADEKVEESGDVKHSFILFLTMVKTSDEKFVESKYGKLKWIDLDKLDDDKIIYSDLWLLQNSLDKSQEIRHVKMQSKDNLLYDFQISD